MAEIQYPEARRGGQIDTYFGTEIADPYRWMEELDAPELKDWVDAENELTRGFLARTPELADERARLHARLMELSDYERVGMPTREAGRYFFQRNTGLQNQAVLYWQADEASEPAVLLDPNGLAADATVALGTYAVSDDGALLAYALSEAGSDVQRVRVRVVATGEDLPDVIEWVKFSGISWARDGAGIYYSSYGPPAAPEEKAETLKRVATFHKLYFHRLGTPQADDQVIYERPEDGELMMAGGATRDGRYVVLQAGKISTNMLALRDLETGVTVEIAPVADAIYSRVGNRGTRFWIMTNKDAPRSRIVEVDLEHPEPEHWRTVVAESADQLEDVAMVGETLVLNYLHDAQSRVELRTLSGEIIREVALPGIGVAHLGAGKREDTDLFFAFTNYTTPGKIYRLTVATGEVTPWRQPRLKFDPGAFETRQLFAISKDGTRVPLFVTMRRGMVPDGSAATLLYGYGGFGVSLGPAYSSSRLLWLEMGGVYAEAILRGGGEYGEDWHLAGTKTRKQNVFDDFTACAELLVREGYTRPERLAINGGVERRAAGGGVRARAAGAVCCRGAAGGRAGYAAFRPVYDRLCVEAGLRLAQRGGGGVSGDPALLAAAQCARGEAVPGDAGDDRRP